VPALTTRAACTNSAFLSEMICPRTTREVVSHETSASETKRLRIFLPKMATKMMTISMYGSPYMTSTNRIAR
jgi:hypothetical protein